MGSRNHEQTTSDSVDRRTVLKGIGAAGVALGGLGSVSTASAGSCVPPREECGGSESIAVDYVHTADSYVVGEPIQFTPSVDLGGDDLRSYRWYVNSESECKIREKAERDDEVEGLTHAFTSPGTYTVVLAVTTEQGGCEYERYEFEILAADEPSVSAPVSVTRGREVSMECTTDVEFEECNWEVSYEDSSETVARTSGRTATVTPESSGTLIVEVRIRNEIELESESVTIYYRDDFRIGVGDDSTSEETPTPTETEETPTPTETGDSTPTPTEADDGTPTPTDSEDATPTPAETNGSTPTPNETVEPTPTATDTSEVTPMGNDLDGDGLYEDVNGNEELEFGDLSEFYEQKDSGVVTKNPSAYDFDGDGDLDFGDVDGLFEMI